MKYQISKKYLLAVILCLVTTRILEAATDPSIVTEDPNAVHATPSTLSPAQVLVEAIKTDSKGFQNIQDLIDGKTAAPPHTKAPTAAPVVKKQVNLAVEKKAEPSAKSVLEQNMAEIEKINLMDTPSAPKSEKSNKVPAAQSIPVSSGSASRSSSSSNNGKIIGSAVGGGLCGLALIVGSVFAIVHAKRKRNNKVKESATSSDLADEAGYGGIEEDVE